MTCTATSRRSRPSSTTRDGASTASSSAATTRSSAAGRRRRSSDCARCRTRSGSAATASAGPPTRTTRPTTRSRRRGIEAARAALGDAARGRPRRAARPTPTRGDTLICHGSPVSDVRSFFPEPAEDEAELLDGITADAPDLRPHPPPVPPHGRTASSWSTPAVSGCRSTATRARPTRSSTTTARSSTAASPTTTRRAPPRCASIGTRVGGDRRQAHRTRPRGRLSVRRPGLGSAGRVLAGPRRAARARPPVAGRRRRPGARLRRRRADQRGLLRPRGGGRRGSAARPRSASGSPLGALTYLPRPTDARACR